MSRKNKKHGKFVPVFKELSEVEELRNEFLNVSSVGKDRFKGIINVGEKTLSLIEVSRLEFFVESSKRLQTKHIV